MQLAIPREDMLQCLCGLQLPLVVERPRQPKPHQRAQRHGRSHLASASN